MRRAVEETLALNEQQPTFLSVLGHGDHERQAFDNITRSPGDAVCRAESFAQGEVQ